MREDVGKAIAFYANFIVRDFVIVCGESDFLEEFDHSVPWHLILLL